MAELKRFEYIIELEPFALQNDNEICFKSKHTQKLIRCSDCRHRDPEDKKCDCGGIERQGCPFEVADDYFCAYGESK